jgi:hypothetical protein
LFAWIVINSYRLRHYNKCADDGEYFYTIILHLRSDVLIKIYNTRGIQFIVKIGAYRCIYGHNKCTYICTYVAVLAIIEYP